MDRRSARGITRSGQSKSGAHQPHQDDRYDVNDRRRYVLGWAIGKWLPWKAPEVEAQEVGGG